MGATVKDYAVEYNDLDGFLDELRFRGPNVEPVVRVRAGYGAHTHYACATYLRVYGERGSVVRLHFVTDWDFPGFGYFDYSPEEREAARVKAIEKEQRRERAYADALAKITAVATEIGVSVVGGEVVLNGTAA